ncbi:ABC transporter C family member 3 isoform X1 [Amborella trichopoda]|nr:ABC transporter C family member 3 isoform X1 [Amborella trichopoda]|eukprot:XP_006839138.3 ABC transporter C family member 3 isoform X1 [Amborella trichopoda]
MGEAMNPIWRNMVEFSGRFQSFYIRTSDVGMEYISANGSLLLLHALSSVFHLGVFAFVVFVLVGKGPKSSQLKTLSKPRFSRPYKLSLFLCFALSAFYAFLSVFNFIFFRGGEGGTKSFVAIESDLIIRTLAWSVTSVYLQSHLPKGGENKFSLLLRIWLLFFFIISLTISIHDFFAFRLRLQSIPLYYLYVDGFMILCASLLCYMGFFGTIRNANCEETTIREPLLNGTFVERKPGEDGERRPYATAGLFRIFTFSWMNPLLTKGYKKALDLDDVPELAEPDSVNGVYPVVREKLEGNAVSTWQLTRALVVSVWREVFITGFWALLYTCASYVGPYLIDSFVQYLNGIQQFEHQGYFLVLAFFFSKMVECIAQRRWFFMLQQVGIRNKAALVAMIYRKGLSLSSQSRQSHMSGEIINFMSVDAERIGDFSWYMHDLWMVPVQVLFALLVLYRCLGLASVAALVATFLVMLANLPMGILQEEYQGKLMESKDKRMKSMSEVLRNMRILKLQGWEMRFLSKIVDLRKVELSWLWKFLYTSAMTTFVSYGAPSFVSVVTFGACLPMGIPLKSGKILSALATFRVLQEPIYNLPDLISMTVQTKVSLDRIASFLRLEDLPSDTVETLQRHSSEIAVEVSNGSFSWDPSSPSPSLKDLNFRVLRGMKVAVCGTVGSGKSSLLSCILGEVPKVSGTVKMCGTKAYVAQSPWIQSGKIEDNILFGNEMERDRYERVLEACALKKDLDILPFGDQTVIGERGINLSGGQKQRIQIARAIYQDADIYLFDDPFSAVDAHTGTHLFQECLLRFLASKTVIYVTHQVEFLPAADIVLVMRDGKITQAGKYDSILSFGTDFMGLVDAHNKALEAIDSVKLGKQESRDLESSQNTVKTSTSAEPKLDFLGGKVNEPVVENQNKGQLIQEEEREKGSVGFSVYWKYITAAYGGALVPHILMAQILFQILQIGSNYWMAWATPVSEDSEPTVSPLLLLLIYVALAVVSSFCILARSLLHLTAVYKTAAILFEKMHLSIFRSPMSFFDSTPTGRILNRASTDQSAVDMLIPFQIGAFAFTVIQLLGIIAVMSQVAWQVFIVFIPVIVVSIWYQQYYIPTARELARLVGVCEAPVIQHFAESISGSTTIRSFDKESRFMTTNLKLIDAYSRPKFYNAGAIEWLCFRLDMLSALTFAFSLVFLVTLPKGIIDPGIAGLAVTYGLNLNMLQAWVVWNLCNLENKMISVERIFQYSSMPSEPPLVIEESRPDPKWPLIGEVKIHDLQVRYAPQLPLVLRGITCTFPGGLKTGIVGRTGSGKSTLIQVLFRIVDPVGGQILIDGIDIFSIGLHDLRSRLSIIPQDPTMFEGTIRSNLDPLEEYSDDEIWAALDKCQLGEGVKQKDMKLESIVSENGENWSVGQRQLLCLGRVLLKKSKVLVLDEATAAVDTTTDSLIQQTIRKHFSDCTVITIAHRTATVLDSDMVLLLDNGIVAEFDSPSVLLENKLSSFSKLVAEYTMRSSTCSEK